MRQWDIWVGYVDLGTKYGLMVNGVVWIAWDFRRRRLVFWR